MVGKLQTNKVKYALKLFDYIHSLDNFKLAKKISDEQKKFVKKPKLFILVDCGSTSNEAIDFLNKYKSSSQFKGQCSENMVETILNKMYPTAEIINATAFKASGDFIIKRTDGPDIMIENKNPSFEGFVHCRVSSYDVIGVAGHCCEPTPSHLASGV